MNIVVAIDSLKGSLTSLEAGNAIKQGIERVYTDANISIRPLADGGEGTVEALTLGMGGRLESVVVTGPLGKPVSAEYGILEGTNDSNHKTAIIEMSAAAGLTLVEEKDRNPIHTTTYGVGELIKDAIAKGCRHFIVGIGGSATNDGGIGMLQALGFGMLNKNGTQVSYGASGLKELRSITDDDVIPELSECTFRVACDVSNTLCGELGCSAIYGPQKGASPTMIMRMDRWLANYASLCKEKYPHSDKDIPGTGAAGGLGFAFMTFTNAILESGIKIVLEETKLEDYIKDADIVITGEGRLDGQTAMGKAPVGVARIAKEHNKKVLAFSGSATDDAYLCNEHGIDAFFPIIRSAITLQEAMSPDIATNNMIATVEQVFRAIKTFE